MDDYVRTPEVFREVSDIYPSTGGLPEPPGGLLGLMCPSGEEEVQPGQAARPLSLLSELDKEGAAPPFLLSFSPFLLLSYSN